MSDKTETDAIVAHAKSPEVVYIQGSPNLVLPPGWTSQSVEHLLPAPLKVIESPVFNDVDSFCYYYQVFAKPNGGTRLYADDTATSITAVFDGSEPDQPGHGFHRTSLKMVLSPEWEVSKKKDGVSMDRNAFTRFLEKNLEYINATDEGMSGAKIMSMCRDLRVKGTGDVNITENYADGKRSLDIKLNHQMGGNSPDGTLIPFPETLKVALRVFRNTQHFDFQARLRWDIKDKSLSFIIDLPEVSTVEDEAFAKIVRQVETNLAATVLRGTYRGGSSHGK